MKWLRGDEGYVSYDYVTAGSEAAQKGGAGSFGLHVTVAEADPELESVLDMVAASIIFNQKSYASLAFSFFLFFSSRKRVVDSANGSFLF